MTSALYAGTVVHQRFKPRQHRLRYRLAQILLDLDAMPSLRLFSHNRFNLVSFYDRDHLDGSATALRGQVEQALVAAGLQPDGGAIRLLCMPRIFGHAFNPISVFFCHRRDGSLMALLYEVNNTFGQRHSYLIPVVGPDEGIIHQHCDKAFYVSPFMRMDMTYAFHVVPPGETTAIVVHGDDVSGPGHYRILYRTAAGFVRCRPDPHAAASWTARPEGPQRDSLGSGQAMAQGAKDTAQTVAARPLHHHRFYQSRLTNV